MPGEEVPTEALRRFWRASLARDSAEPLVDEQTWMDLDMEAVYARIDRTISAPGRMALYRMLRSPGSSSPLP